MNGVAAWPSGAMDLLFPGLIAIAVVGSIVIGAIVNDRAKKKREAELLARLQALLAKYGDVEIAQRILQRMFWQGMTREMLLDSLGMPADIDEKVLKTKVKEVWKYYRTGGNRFGLRITVENGVVIGWDEKL